MSTYNLLLTSSPSFCLLCLFFREERKNITFSIFSTIFNPASWSVVLLVVGEAVTDLNISGMLNVHADKITAWVLQ